MVAKTASRRAPDAAKCNNDREPARSDGIPAGDENLECEDFRQFARRIQLDVADRSQQIAPIRDLALPVKRIKIFLDSINSICSITNIKGLLKILAFTNLTKYYS